MEPSLRARQRLASALRYCFQPANLQRTTTIAVIVGTVLTAINLGDVLLAGQLNGATVLKVLANYATPFVVANAGLLGGRRHSSRED